MITGMPSGRILVLSLAFGIHTRRTATGCHEPRVACTRTATSARTWLDRATCPSTPAVRRPVLRCVTCRTLISVFDQDRSTNRCRFLAVARSPSFTATAVPAARAFASPPDPRRPRRKPSPGPQVRSPKCPTCPLVLAYTVLRFTGSPVHVSTPFGAGHRPGIRPVIRRPSERSSRCYGLRFPAAFPPPAFASWTPCPARRDSAPLTVGLPPPVHIPAHH